MRDFIKETLKFFWMFLLCFIILGIFLLILLLFISWIQHISLLSFLLKDLALLNVAGGILTMSLIVVAGLQLRRLNRTSTADFLLRIDNRYGDKEISAWNRICVTGGAVVYYQKNSKKSEK